MGPPQTSFMYKATHKVILHITQNNMHWVELSWEGEMGNNFNKNNERIFETVLVI